jgi:hypothetical protein
MDGHQVTEAAATPGTPPETERHNPFVGPNALSYGEKIYGRSREINELESMLVAQRIVLLYSPSGAGKTSLLEAGLRPELERRHFGVFPTIRVGYQRPETFDRTAVRNPYILSALTSLEEGRPPDDRLNPSELADVALDDYLQRLADEGDSDLDPCLIFDQFEELFILDPTDLIVKRAFLVELGAALRDPGRWALFSMREDFIAQLDPYLTLIPNRFSTRYRLGLLDPGAAQMAAQRTAADAGVDFVDDAAGLLIDDLRRVRVQRGTLTSEELGPSIEPVQLQVACRQLWVTLDPDARSIGADDIVALGSVDDALADFYAAQLHAAAVCAGASEREIRTWFDEELISESGFRTQVLEGPGLDGAAVLRELENAHLIRAERRRGAEWYELAHDRLIEPIRASNAAWRETELSNLQREAQVWERRGRPAGLLLTGANLAEAESWAQQHASEMLPIDEDLLKTSRTEQQRAELQHKAVRRWLVAAATTSVIALAALVAVGFLLVRATGAEREAERQAERAERQTERVSELLANRVYSSDTAPGGSDALGVKELRDECASGNMAACDELYFVTPAGSDDQVFGSFCGDPSAEPVYGECVETFGSRRAND